MRVQVMDDHGQVLHVDELQPKTFNSGRSGYWGNGKVTLEGKRYQFQAQVVEIKPKK